MSDKKGENIVVVKVGEFCAGLEKSVFVEFIKKVKGKKNSPLVYFGEPDGNAKYLIAMGVKKQVEILKKVVERMRLPKKIVLKGGRHVKVKAIPTTEYVNNLTEYKCWVYLSNKLANGPGHRILNRIRAKFVSVEGLQTDVVMKDKDPKTPKKVEKVVKKKKKRRRRRRRKNGNVNGRVNKAQRSKTKEKEEQGQRVPFPKEFVGRRKSSSGFDIMGIINKSGVHPTMLIADMGKSRKVFLFEK